MKTAAHLHDKVFVTVLDFRGEHAAAECLVCGELWLPRLQENGTFSPGALKCPGTRGRHYPVEGPRKSL